MNKQETLKTSLQQRKEEIFGYQLNIDNYTLMISRLPSVWPEDLLKFRGSDLATLVANIQDEAQIMLVADLIFRDKLAATLMTEKLEQRKALLVRDILAEQIKD
jgi:hypothetical protein